MTATHTIAYTQTGVFAAVHLGQDIRAAIAAEADRAGCDLSDVTIADVMIVHEDEAADATPVFKGFDMTDGELVDGCHGPLVAVRA